MILDYISQQQLAKSLKICCYHGECYDKDPDDHPCDYPSNVEGQCCPGIGFSRVIRTLVRFRLAYAMHACMCACTVLL